MANGSHTHRRAHSLNRLDFERDRGIADHSYELFKCYNSEGSLIVILELQRGIIAKEVLLIIVIVVAVVLRLVVMVDAVPVVVALAVLTEVVPVAGFVQRPQPMNKAANETKRVKMMHKNRVVENIQGDFLRFGHSSTERKGGIIKDGRKWLKFIGITGRPTCAESR